MADPSIILEREYSWVRDKFPPNLSPNKKGKSLPFIALNMAKCRNGKPGSTDEFFLNQNNEPLDSKQLLKNELKGLCIKQFRKESYLAKEYNQAKFACSIADLYLLLKKLEVVIELEVFKDKPFSNLIYIPEACRLHDRALLFLHVFAPLRVDVEAELTRAIGQFLATHSSIDKLYYVPLIMPPLPPKISYLLPCKKAKNKAQGFQQADHEKLFRRYLAKFARDCLVYKIQSHLGIA